MISYIVASSITKKLTIAADATQKIASGDFSVRIPDKGRDEVAPEILNRAINDYHKYLHYYVEGLSKANSPYAHHTVGSTMSFDFDAYAKVRGYPKREAGEDFYLLNKLSKLGSVENLDLSPITLQGRPSDRVPFGTGQANRKLYELYQAGQEFQVYHPNCFKVLEAYLNCARAYYDDLDEFYFLLSLDDQCDGIIDDLEKFIEGVKKDFFTEIISASKRAKDKEGQLKHFNTWFDGFKTLKFVHWIRDEFCGTAVVDGFWPFRLACPRPFILARIRSEIARPAASSADLLILCPEDNFSRLSPSFFVDSPSRRWAIKLVTFVLMRSPMTIHLLVSHSANLCQVKVKIQSLNYLSNCKAISGA